jgi:DNA polymerase III subunit chi
MSEVLFYHLERRSLEDALPALVSRTLERGWKALVRCESAARAEDVDRLLWTYDDQSFLPHGLASEPDAARQPALIAVESDNVNNADVLFLVGGAPPPAWDGEAATFVRVVLLFDGRDPSAVAAARESWTAARSAGHEITYWKENAAGKWEKQG